MSESRKYRPLKPTASDQGKRTPDDRPTEATACPDFWPDGRHLDPPTDSCECPPEAGATLDARIDRLHGTGAAAAIDAAYADRSIFTDAEATAATGTGETGPTVYCGVIGHHDAHDWDNTNVADAKPVWFRCEGIDPSAAPAPSPVDEASDVEALAWLLLEHRHLAHTSTPPGWICTCGALIEPVPEQTKFEVWIDHMAHAVLAAGYLPPAAVTAEKAAAAETALREAADAVRFVREHGLPDGVRSHPTAEHFELWLLDRAEAARGDQT